MVANRFVILRHEGLENYKPGVHWDLMLEESGTLRTWALAAEPAIGQTIAAEPLPDHRLAYLDYEGPIAGNRGVVSRWDCGSYELLSSAVTNLSVLLRGNRLCGRATLTRDRSNPETWTFLVTPVIS